MGFLNSLSLAWTATSVIVSALLYLFDFTTNITTLVTYHHNGSLATYHLNRSLATVPFRMGVTIIVMAHVTNSIVFWVLLDPNKHRFRMAHFLPMIHVWRLVKVLFNPRDWSSLADKLDKEANNLYSVLGMSLETGPLFILQLYVLLIIGWKPAESSKILILSLMASFLSIFYNAIVTILPLVTHDSLSIGKVCIAAVAAGFHAIAALSAMAMVVLLSSFIEPLKDNPIYFLSYSTIGFIAPFLFNAFLQWNISRDALKTIAQCFAIAHVSLRIGPLYVTTKSFKDHPKFYRFMIIASFLHALVEIVWIVCILILFRSDLSIEAVASIGIYVGIILFALLILVLSAWAFVVVNGKRISSNTVQELTSNNIENGDALPQERQF